ncbi:MAG: AgmX/PglI C-terminal domain-containing protein [Pseudomonadota bacterium]
MNKIHKERHIYALIDGRLSEEKERRLVEHLDDCPDCREFLAQCKAVRKELGRIGEHLPESVDWNLMETRIDRLVRRSEREKAAPASAPFFGEFFWKAAFACAAALLVFALYLVYENYSGNRADEQAALMAGGKDGRETYVPLSDSMKSSPMAVTFTSKNVEWSMPGISPKELDLSTSIRENMTITAKAGATAGIQIGRGTGLRIEPRTSVTVGRPGGGEIALQLDRGAVSVDYAPDRKGVKLSVRTPEATVTVKGTLFSVSRSEEATSVVVSRGTVVVTPGKNGEGAVKIESAQGVYVGRNGKITALERDSVEPEKDRLEQALFNVFRAELPEDCVSIDGEGQENFACLDLGGKKQCSPSLSLRSLPGRGEAKVMLKDGEEISLSYNVSKGLATRLKYSQEAKPALLAGKAEALQPAKVKKLKLPGEEPAEKSVDSGIEVEEEAEGTIDPYVVELKIQKEKGRMRACYEKYLAKDPKEKIVKARVHFTIGTSGKVTKASSTSLNQNEELSSCLREVIKSIVFPQPYGGAVKFEYPMTFTPK